MDNIIKSLFETIEDRKNNPEEGSYTSYLFEKGIDKILKKCGEECSEMIIAAKNKDDKELTLEICDLVYHMLVLVSVSDIGLKGIEEELTKRSAKKGNLKVMKTVDKNS